MSGEVAKVEPPTAGEGKDRQRDLAAGRAHRLFGRFERLSAKPTGGESSTGLGLSIAKRIVDLHDGRIRADPAPGRQGSVFTIVLPRGAASEAAAAITPP